MAKDVWPEETGSQTMEAPVLLVSFVSRVTQIMIVPMDIILGLDDPAVSQPRLHKSQKQTMDGLYRASLVVTVQILFVTMINVTNAQTVTQLLEPQHQLKVQFVRQRVQQHPGMLKWRSAMKEHTKAVVPVQRVVHVF